MLAIFRLFSMLGTVVAFIRSPKGQQLIGRARSFITHRADRQKASAVRSQVR